MRRRALLAAALLAALLATVAATDARAADPYRVYLVAWRGWEDACQGFKDYFTAEGIPIEVIFRDAGRDKSKLPLFVAEAKALDVDLVVTWGTSVTLGMLGTHDGTDPAKHITDIPSVFMIVSQPVGAKVVPDFTSSGRNVAGTSYLVSEATQLKVARSYRPFDRLAVIYNPLEKNSVLNVTRLERLADSEGFELLARPVPVDAEGKPDAEALPGLVAEVAAAGAQWLYQGPDSFLNVNRDVLTGEAVRHGVPVFAAGENPVRRASALLGVVNRYYMVGQFTAHQAVRILVDKVSPRDLPIASPSRFSLIINMDVAKTLGLYPPINLLKFAEVIPARN